MHCMLVTVAAVFLQFKPRGRILLVLLSGIIAPLAFVTRECDNQTIFFLRHVRFW